jgi:acetyl esterase
MTLGEKTMTGDRQLEPKTQKFIDALAAQGGKPIYQLSNAEARAVLEGLQSQPVDKLPAVEEDRTIPGGPSGQVSVRIIRPEKATGKLPVIMYFHGGGWILGSKDTHDRLVREIAQGANAAGCLGELHAFPRGEVPRAHRRSLRRDQILCGTWRGTESRWWAAGGGR